jgi:hypothetical protein
MHGAGNGDSTAVVNHAFVEPVPTPQPPADATATISERDIGVLESMGRANGRGEPAGPPVTGDRDAAPSQLYWELVDIDDLGTWKDLVRSVLDRCHAAGLARGRALGARDAVRPEVAAFAQLMEQQLRANDGKGGWKEEQTAYLSRRCGNELEELREANQRQRKEWMQGSPPVDAKKREALKVDVGREAADVANFAMMIADVCGALEARRAGREE